MPGHAFVFSPLPPLPIFLPGLLLALFSVLHSFQFQAKNAEEMEGALNWEQQHFRLTL